MLNWKKIWDTLQKVITYTVLGIGVLAGILTYFIRIDLREHLGGVVAFLSFTLLMLSLNLHEQFRKSILQKETFNQSLEQLLTIDTNKDEENIVHGNTFDEGLRCLLEIAKSRDGEIRTLDIFSQTTATYIKVIALENLKITKLRILVSSNLALEGKGLSPIEVETEWETLFDKHRGNKLIDSVVVEHYDSLSPIHFAIVNGKFAFWGFYDMPYMSSYDQSRKSKLFYTYDILGNDTLCDSLRDYFKKFFNSFFPAEQSSSIENSDTPTL